MSVWDRKITATAMVADVTLRLDADGLTIDLPYTVHAYDRGDVEALRDALVEALDMMSPAAAVSFEVGAVLTGDDMDALPTDSRVRDSDEDIWIKRQDDRWRTEGMEPRDASRVVQAFGPVTFIDSPQ